MLPFGTVPFHFEHLKLLKFDFNSDPDPASLNNADPNVDPQPWFNCSGVFFDDL